MEARLMTAFDHERLRELVEHQRRVDPISPFDALALERELERAVLIDELELPADVVTMNSKLRVVDSDTGDALELRIVFPSSADVSRGRISVLAPVGLAMLGSRGGDDVIWRVPRRVRRFRIERVGYQPEASGDLKRLRARLRPERARAA